MVQELWRPCVDGASATETHRRVRGHAPGIEVPAGHARQLSGVGITYEGWSAQDEGLPQGIRRLRRYPAGIALFRDPTRWRQPSFSSRLPTRGKMDHDRSSHRWHVRAV